MTTELIAGFMLVLARIGGLAVFVPWPGAKQTTALAKAAFALLLTLTLAPVWPRVEAGPALVVWLAGEAAIGVTIGLAFALVNECFAVAGQLLGLQAGFSYASSIDPASQADTTVIPILVQLLTSLLFFALGLDRHLIAMLAASLEACPPAACLTAGSMAGMLAGVTKLASMALAGGVRLALPLIGLMVTVDVLLALLGRFCPQFQLTTAAFPLKIALAVFVLAALVPAMTPMYESLSREAFRLLGHLLHTPVG